MFQHQKAAVYFTQLMNDRTKIRIPSIRSNDEKGLILNKSILTFKMILSKHFSYCREIGNMYLSLKTDLFILNLPCSNG